MVLFTRLRSIARFTKICCILAKQLLLWPWRLLTGRGNLPAKVVGDYLSPAIPGASAA